MTTSSGPPSKPPMDMFEAHRREQLSSRAPLATRMRPRTLDDLVGQDHVIGAGEKLFKAMCDAGQEGIISKAIDAPYRSTRSKSWVKVNAPGGRSS